jgi:hypothetical protein
MKVRAATVKQVSHGSLFGVFHRTLGGEQYQVVSIVVHLGEAARPFGKRMKTVSLSKHGYPVLNYISPLISHI